MSARRRLRHGDLITLDGEPVRVEAPPCVQCEANAIARDELRAMIKAADVTLLDGHPSMAHQRQIEAEYLLAVHADHVREHPCQPDAGFVARRAALTQTSESTHG